jgi:hypothetical protein
VTINGHGAERTRWVETEPSITRRRGPYPREPTTMSVPGALATLARP